MLSPGRPGTNFPTPPTKFAACQGNNLLNIVGNPRFFTNTGPHALCAVAAAAGCIVEDTAVMIAGLASLDEAEADQISFLGDSKNAAMLDATRAGAVLVSPATADRVPVGCVALVTDDPGTGWALVAALFHPVTGARPGVQSPGRTSA